MQDAKLTIDTNAERLSLEVILAATNANREVVHRLSEIQATLARIEAQGKREMAAFVDVKAAIDAVNQHTSDLSTKVDGVVTSVNQIIADLKAKAGDPVALQAAIDELSTVSTGLDAISTHLDAIGQDPANPLPPPPAV